MKAMKSPQRKIAPLRARPGAPGVLDRTTEAIRAAGYGVMEFQLFQDLAPTVTNRIMHLANSGFYDGLTFHRIISGFMIQGGGYLEGLKEKKTKGPIKKEAENGLLNETGTIAMARTSDPHSASAQFFINVNDNVSLNHRSPTPAGWGYAVFGRVVSGMHVVNRIKSVKTGNLNGHANVPMDTVTIKSVRRKAPSDKKSAP
jgi:peptidyl-prolyl cis-trans isomerase B (cyclophilin B)